MLLLIAILNYIVLYCIKLYSITFLLLLITKVILNYIMLYYEI